MAQSDGKKWLEEFIKVVMAQLQQDRQDIGSLFDKINAQKESHVSCREEILGRLGKALLQQTKDLSDFDKKLSVAIVRITTWVTIMVTIIMAIINYGFLHLLGKV